MRFALLALLLGLLTSGPAVAQRTAWNFDDQPAGRPPSGFTFAGVKEQQNPWTILRDGANNVLGVLQSAATGSRLAVVEGTSLSNLTLSVRARFVDGRRSAGLVWRYRDADNYYLATLDLRQQDLRVYRVVRGNRTRLDDEDELELDPAAWHLLKIEHRGTRMRLWIDGVPVSDARDRSIETAGAVGVWTTGDSIAWFDDLSVEPVQVERGPERRR